MTKLTTLFLASSALIISSAHAFSVGDYLGTNEEEIRTALTEAGYTIQEVEVESDEIEAEVMKDGAEVEFEIATADGKIVEIEMEDEDGDDGNDGDDGDDDDKDDEEDEKEASDK